MLFAFTVKNVDPLKELVGGYWTGRGDDSPRREVFTSRILIQIVRTEIEEHLPSVVALDSCRKEVPTHTTSTCDQIMLKEERVFGLDLVRAVAILLVVLHHGFEIWPFPFPPLPDGVDIFFVLSGFLIGRILMKVGAPPHAFTHDDLLLFLCRRWLRTLPAFGVVLLINLVIIFFVEYYGLPSRQIVKKVLLEDRLWEYGLFVQNFATNLRSNFFPESWSLAVEEWFYIIFPLTLFFYTDLDSPVRFCGAQPA